MQEFRDRWVEGWHRAIGAARGRGARDCRLEIDRPATAREVGEVERSIGRPLPEPFKKTLLEFSRRVDFFWSLGEGDRPPEPLNHVSCGGCHWDLGRLAEMYEEARWLSANAFVEDTPEERLWRDKLPFHAIASGDCIAIDVSSGDPQPIVYLSHDLDFGHGYVLGADFFDFLDRWTAIGCPDDDIWPYFVPKRVKGLDLGHPNVVAWCHWFGLPQPSGGLSDATTTPAT